MPKRGIIALALTTVALVLLLSFKTPDDALPARGGGGRVADVVALQVPTGRRSGQISRVAAPILLQEALGAQSASIDLVSGATYSSDAYAQSLRAALHQAGLR